MSQSTWIIISIWLWLFLAILGCSNRVEEYIAKEELSSEKASSLRNKVIAPGMKMAEVQLVLGEPQRTQANEDGRVVWIYEQVAGISARDAYNPVTSFPQGIGYVVPLNYQCRELRVMFDQDVVYRVEKLLQ